MKNSLIFAAALVAGSAANADITCLAPGFGSTELVIGSNSSWVYQSQNLGRIWSYKITGIQYKLTSAARFDGAVWKGALVKGLHGNDKKLSYPGSSFIWVWANGQWILTNASIYSTHVDNTSGIVTQYFNPPLEFHDETVSIGFAYFTNMRTDADMVRVLGESVSVPPIPTGDISAPNVVRTGASPDLDWDLTRVRNDVDFVGALADDGSESTNSSNNSDEQETTTIDPVITTDPTDGTTTDPTDGTTTDPTDGTTTDPTDGTTTDPDGGTDSGSGNTNNGHGNNVDGVDISNPGKSAQKWADKWGIIDTSAPDDDEGSGGGSAVSQSH